MLKRIKIQGLGPHLDFRAELDPRGPNTVSGPSEAGKTFLVEAVLFALYGRSAGGRFRPEAIHQGADKATVELTLDSGRTIRRSATKSRQTRAIGLAEDETSYASEDAFAQALGDLGRDPEAIQLAMVPMAWVELSAGNARALRDVLARVLPGGDLPTEVRRLALEQGVELLDAEAGMDEASASASRRAARKDRDQAEGRLQLARERTAALGAGALPDAAPPPDPALAARVEAWDAYDRLAGLQAAREQALAAQADWDRRRETLGPEPAAPKDPGASARAEAAKVKLQAAWQAGQQAGGQLQMLTMQRQMFAGGTDVCPTCARPGWTQGQGMVGQLDAQLVAARQALEAANAAATEAQREVHQAEAQLSALRDARLGAESWARSLAALGARPVVPEAPAMGPPVPDGPRPSPDEVARVRQAQAESQALTELRARRSRELTEAEAVVRREEQALAEAERLCARLDVLLDAVRRAPSAVAERQARALGDLGPVSLEFGDNPAVKVLVDGRPWWLASRGRQVVADAWLRAALRRAMQMPWLTLFVDNCQDVGGQPLPDLPGPVVFLQTTDAKAISVRRKVPREGGPSET